MIDNWPALYLAGEVRRFHTQRVLHPQSVSEHSWGVALLLLVLYAPALPPAALLAAALLHDLPECETGDVPAPAKWDHSALDAALEECERAFWARWPGVWPKLCHAERAALRFADMAELVLYCLSELELGNARLASTAAVRGLQKLREQVELELLLPPNARAVLSQLEYVMEGAR